MPNLWTKLQNWFKPPKPVKRKVTTFYNIKGETRKVIANQAKKDKLTFEQRLKRCEQLIEQLTKEEKGC